MLSLPAFMLPCVPAPPCFPFIAATLAVRRAFQGSLVKDNSRVECRLRTLCLPVTLPCQVYDSLADIHPAGSFVDVLLHGRTAAFRPAASD